MNTPEAGPIDPAPDVLSADPRLGTIVDALQSRKGIDITVMDLRSLSDAADYFVLCTGESDPQIRSLCQEVLDRLKSEGERPWHVEGLGTRRWVLVDFVDIVVHIFRPEAREFYALERLWGDADVVTFEDDAGDPADGYPADEVGI